MFQFFRKMQCTLILHFGTELGYGLNKNENENIKLNTYIHDHVYVGGEVIFLMLFFLLQKIINLFEPYCVHTQDGLLFF